MIYVNINNGIKVEIDSDDSVVDVLVFHMFDVVFDVVIIVDFIVMDR